jgi:diacylglycerol kinase (ATP)
LRLLLLANPRSGAGRAEEVVSNLHLAGTEVEVAAIEDAERFPTTGVDRVAVAGGDGSIGPAAELATRAGVPLAVIPAGTANDFARALGLPDDLEDACRLAVRGTRTRSMELGRMGERPFVNVASAGLPPAAAAEAHNWKPRLGRLAYALGAVRAALRTEPLPCRVRCDGRELFAGDAWQVTVACTGSFGAGSSVDANPHDGWLHAVVVEAGSRAGLLRRAYGLRSGRIRKQRGVHDRRARRARVEVAPGTRFNLDGELCESGPAEFMVEPAAFEVVVG